MATTIEVTAEDIRRGVPRDICFCPVAIAGRRAGLDGCEVKIREILWFKRSPKGLCTWDVASANPPETVTEFVRRFDVGEPVQPFSFTLDADP